MLYWLCYEKLFHLNSHFSPFRVFQYATFRTGMASITALLMAILLGPWLIARLRAFQIGQHIREDGPQTHHKKAGTPTMGGLLIGVSILVPTLLWSNLRTPAVWVALAGLVTFGAVGFLDDYLKIRNKRNLGLRVKQKLALELLSALLIGVMLLAMNAKGVYSTSMNVPFFKNFNPDLLVHAWLRNMWSYPLAFVFFFAFIALVLVGCSDAVNLTDGLDGLAIGLMVIAAGAMTALAYLSGHAEFARYLELLRAPGASELAIFCGTMTGASLGFLWHNAHPAEIFMGDVGSYGLGGGLGTVAVLLKQEILLLFIGGVYVIEALSVILQVGSYKLRGKRVFKMAPLHHHFEQIGWCESKVIARFWIAGLILALFALTTLKLR
ncbi:MAG: phospho-N-acetylmuramoyl-pentapeptide-transferase [Bryobacterales bacterium]|nr:phospho-N-acetylmuramoyl-pentapeptide-transferase [Bryobacterales bacterium]MBV9399103.1 phospho-N-acetylmuramoyl-pentapeptide-transferase [Bryobacterales bacterium]